MKIRTALSITLAALLVCTAAIANAQTFTGSLSSSDGVSGGLRGTGGSGGGPPQGWFPVSISWQVSLNLDNSWNYQYTLQSSYNRDFSHFIVEVSDNFTLSDVFNISTSPATESPSLTTHNPGGGNPSMPGPLYGMKFDGIGEASTWVISFDSNKVPVWGDFYAKDGAGSSGFNTVWNEGFGLTVLDPASSGSILNKILVPDTLTTGSSDDPVPVPEPASMALAGMGLAGVISARRRRMR